MFHIKTWNTYKKLYNYIFTYKAVIWRRKKRLTVVANFVSLTNTAIKMTMAIKLSIVIDTSAFFYQLLFIHNYCRKTITVLAFMLLEWIALYFVFFFFSLFLSQMTFKLLEQIQPFITLQNGILCPQRSYNFLLLIPLKIIWAKANVMYRNIIITEHEELKYYIHVYALDATSIICCKLQPAVSLKKNFRTFFQ